MHPKVLRLMVLFSLICSVISSDRQYKDDKKDLSVYDELNAQNNETYLTCEEETKSNYLDGKFVGKVPSYDVYEVLLNSGGRPGSLNVTWVEETSSPSEPGRRFSYDYKGTDYKTWIRFEKGRLSNPGSRSEYLNVTGTIHWKPDNFCGWFRRAKYSLEKDEFNFEVEYGTRCTLEVDKNGEASGDSDFTCIPVAHCTTEPAACVAGASSSLLAALVGGSG